MEALGGYDSAVVFQISFAGRFLGSGNHGDRDMVYVQEFWEKNDGRN
jgi:hypothetical protein